MVFLFPRESFEFQRNYKNAIMPKMGALKRPRAQILRNFLQYSCAVFYIIPGTMWQSLSYVKCMCVCVGAALNPICGCIGGRSIVAEMPKRYVSAAGIFQGCNKTIRGWTKIQE